MLSPGSIVPRPERRYSRTVAALDTERLRRDASAFSDARLVVLFGSVARGDAASWSDADVGVAGVSFWRGLEIGARLGEALGREPHVVDLEAASDGLRYQVAREGLLLHEGEPGAWARFRAEAALRWFDLQPIVALCAEGVRRRLLGNQPVGELLLRKAAQVRERLVRLRAAVPARPEDVLVDERLEAFLSFHLFLLIQDAVDLAAHLVAARGLAVPASQREVFEALSRAGLLGADTARAMAQMAALRNRIAHSYGDLDPVRLARELPVGLDQVERFIDELKSAVAEG